METIAASDVKCCVFIYTTVSYSINIINTRNVFQNELAFKKPDSWQQFTQQTAFLSYKQL